MTAGPRRSLIVDVLERDSHDFGCAVDRHMAEELQSEAGARSSRWSFLHPFWKIARGPNALSSRCVCQVPACIGPEMNSQNGAKS
jgi:hypothetical protein